MKRYLQILSLFVVILLLGFHAGTVAAKDSEITVIYFYSPTCASCQQISGFLTDTVKKYPNLILEKYDISILKNKSLMDRYCEAYKVLDKDAGIAPILFIRDKYFSLESDITSKLDAEINKSDGSATLVLDSSEENHTRDYLRFSGYSILSVAAAGVVNGINPCSLSMLLFFLSLLAVKNTSVLKAGISFCIGKYIGFLLLGTLLFRFLSLLSIGGFKTIIKVSSLSIISVLVVLNILDSFSAGKQSYNKVKLQLPKAFRKFNHNFMKNIISKNDKIVLLAISIIIGLVISVGEFLCTGQIYLATIVTVLQSGITLNLKSLLYLMIYDIGFITPPLILTFIIFKGKEVFEVSEVIREKLYIIKLVSAGLLIIFGVLIVFIL